MRRELMLQYFRWFWMVCCLVLRRFGRLWMRGHLVRFARGRLMRLVGLSPVWIMAGDVLVSIGMLTSQQREADDSGP